MDSILDYMALSHISDLGPPSLLCSSQVSIVPLTRRSQHDYRTTQCGTYSRMTTIFSRSFDRSIMIIIISSPSKCGGLFWNNFRCATQYMEGKFNNFVMLYFHPLTPLARKLLLEKGNHSSNNFCLRFCLWECIQHNLQILYKTAFIRFRFEIYRNPKLQKTTTFRLYAIP